MAIGCDGDLGAERPMGPAMLRGWKGRCPCCGTGRLFTSFLKTDGACPDCGQDLRGHRADDAPPYFTIFIVGHIIVPLMLLLEQHRHPPEWVHMALWLPATVILCLYLLPRVKGALIGLQFARRMHGFGSEPQ